MTVSSRTVALTPKKQNGSMVQQPEINSWWQDCVLGNFEPVEFRLMDKLTNAPAARVVVWELEGYGWRWGSPAAGILDIQVRPDLRRQGLAKLLISQVMRFVQDQFFGIVEIQAPGDRPEAIALCKSVGLEQVDVGTTYLKASQPA